MIENTTPQLYGTITQSSSGTNNYNSLKNIPSINEVPLKGDLTTEDLGIEIPTKNSELENDSNFITIDDVPKTDLSDYYNKQETNDLLDEKQPSGDYALKSDIPDVSSFITKAVDDLENYYKKSETYTQEEIDQKIADLHSVSFKKVETRPETGEMNVIYLVPNEDEEDENIYDEYIYDEGWEKIGSTKIDLSNYYDKTQIDEMLENVGGKQFTEITTNSSKIRDYEPGCYITTTSHTLKISSDTSLSLNKGAIIMTKYNGQRIEWTVISQGAVYVGASTRNGDNGYGYSTLYWGDSSTSFFSTIPNYPVLTSYNAKSYVLTKDNTTAYTPTSNYHPSTKKYVDDSVKTVSDQIGDINTILATLTTVSEVSE